MCYGRDKNVAVIDRNQYRRLLKLEKTIREAIDGADLDAAFRVQSHSRYDQGRYDGMMYIVGRVYNVLPGMKEDEEVPF